MGTVLQYTLVYCSEKGIRKAVCIAIQTGCAGRGVGQELGAGGGAQALGTQGAGRERALGKQAQGAGVRRAQASGECRASRRAGGRVGLA